VYNLDDHSVHYLNQLKWLSAPLSSCPSPSTKSRKTLTTDEHNLTSLYAKPYHSDGLPTPKCKIPLSTTGSTQLNTKLQTQVSNTSKSTSIYSTYYVKLISPCDSPDQFPVPVRSVAKSNLTSRYNQNLHKHALNK